MKIINHHALTMASATLFCGVVVGQESIGGASSQAIAETELKAGDVRASNLLGAIVKRLTGDSIGEVEELIVSADADVRLAVISVGGILGVGEKTIAIPFDQFMVAPDGSTVYLTMTEEELRMRPAFDLESQNTEFRSASDEPEVPTARTTPEPNNLVATPADTHGAPEHSAVAQPLTAHEGAEQGSERAVSKSKASKQAASTLIGADVVDSQNSPIGKINDLIVTAEPAEVQVILALSGDLGSRLVAVPLPELTLRRDGASHGQIESVETTLTASQLAALPQFHP